MERESIQGELMERESIQGERSNNNCPIVDKLKGMQCFQIIIQLPHQDMLSKILFVKRLITPSANDAAMSKRAMIVPRVSISLPLHAYC